MENPINHFLEAGNMAISVREIVLWFYNYDESKLVIVLRGHPETIKIPCRDSDWNELWNHYKANTKLKDICV